MDNRLLYNEIQKIKIMLDTIKVSGKEHFNVKEAALYLGISESTLYKFTSNNTISFYQPNGKLIFFKKSDLDNFIERGRKKNNDEIKEEAQNRIKNFKTF